MVDLWFYGTATLIRSSYQLPGTAVRDVDRHVAVLVVTPNALVDKGVRDAHSGDLFGCCNCLSQRLAVVKDCPDTSSRQ